MDFINRTHNTNLIFLEQLPKQIAPFTRHQIVRILYKSYSGDVLGICSDFRPLRLI